MNRIKRLVIVGVLGILSGCGHQMRYLTSEGELVDGWSAVSDTKYIRTIGIGVAPDNVKDRTRRKGMSRNSALVGARTELIGMVHGLRIKGSLEISRLVEQKDRIRQIVDATVAGAEEERVQWDRTDGCVVVLRIERRRVQRMVEDTARHEAADPEEATATLEKQIAMVDGRTKAMLAKLPGMGAE